MQLYIQVNSIWSRLQFYNWDPLLWQCQCSRNEVRVLKNKSATQFQRRHRDYVRRHLLNSSNVMQFNFNNKRIEISCLFTSNFIISKLLLCLTDCYLCMQYRLYHSVPNLLCIKFILFNLYRKLNIRWNHKWQLLICLRTEISGDGILFDRDKSHRIRYARV